MRAFISIFLMFVGVILSEELIAQTDTLSDGKISGKITDSIQQIPMNVATVAIYKFHDTTLLAYTLSDKDGAFLLTKVPRESPLKMVVSFAGYKSVVRNIRIPSTLTELNIGNISMSVSYGGLEEVIVLGKHPPVRMKGDTIEFHSDAFTLDPNAQAEDLLRILPGITIWTDGVITVNGKEVGSVVVNGRPFFGKDASVATQNIPKSIIDKVQVYQRDINNGNADSVTEINIKLKKGNEAGYFGKIGAGIANQRRHEIDGSYNYFTHRTQLSLGVVKNNINKFADGMSTLLANHTFKGSGAGHQYQSNFSLPGLNKYHAGGVTLQQDFIASDAKGKISRLNSEYFGSVNHQSVMTGTNTYVAPDDTSYFIQRQYHVDNSSLINHQANAIYEKKTARQQFSLSGFFNRQIFKDSVDELLSMITKEQALLSSNNVNKATFSQVNHFTAITRFSQIPEKLQNRKAFSSFNLDYSIIIEEANRKTNYRSVYVAAREPGLNRELDRLYNSNRLGNTHKLKAVIPHLLSGFSKVGFFPRFNMGIKAEFDLVGSSEKNIVMDKDLFTNRYISNTYLTNNRREVATDFKPAISITRSIAFNSDNSSAKKIDAEISAGPQFFSLHSFSEKQYQQFSKSYNKLVGISNLRFESLRNGRSFNIIAFQFAASSQYPTVERIAPLIDSANQNFIQYGNLDLKEQDTREFSFQMIHDDLRRPNAFSSSFILAAGYVNNHFVQSKTIDTLGRTASRVVNANGYRYMKFNGQIRKAFRRDKKLFQFVYSPSLLMDRTPIIINSNKRFFNNFNIISNPSFVFSVIDRFELRIANNLSVIRLVQKGAGSFEITNTVNQLEVSAQINCTKKITAGSNLLYTINSVNNKTENSFTIWNANLVCRMFRNNNAELKFSALDILRQNKGLINHSSANTITQGTTNVLQQYFMISASWFPRKFGNNKHP